MLVIFTLAFWKQTGWGLVRTALAAVVPFLPGLFLDPAGSWRQAASTVAVTLVAAIATSLNGLPDASSGNVFAIAFQRAVRQFGQYVVGGLVGALMLSDVDWRSLLIAAAASAVTTFVLAMLTLLPGAATLTEAPAGTDGVPDITSLSAPAGEPQVSVGRIVAYTASDADAEASKAPGWTGNQITAGDVLPAVVVRVWSGGLVNLQVLVDGTDSLWRTSVKHVDAPGTPFTWAWPALAAAAA